MKKLIKYLALYSLIAFLIIVVAAVAAPFFVRQDQVKDFIEKRVALPDNQQMKLDGKIKFGVFPYMHARIPKVKIISQDGKVKEFEECSFGFNTMDLLKTAITFDVSFEFNENEYEGSLNINDYQALLNNGLSPINLRLEEPLPLKVKGDLIHSGNEYSLQGFKTTYKQTTGTGNLKVISGKNGLTQIDLNTEITSDNIENIRRLIELGRNDDDFNLLSGKGKVKLNITTKGTSGLEFKQNLNGEGDVSINDAAIYGIDLNELIGSPQSTELTENSDRKIDIEEADAVFKIDNGIIKVEELNANNQFANVTGSGIIDIPANSVRMGIDINADIASAKVNIPLLVYGSLNKIKFAPRVGDTILGNIDNLTNISQIKLKNVKLKIDKESIGRSVEQLKTIGKNLGLDIEKLTGNKTIAEPATPAESAVPAEPMAIPASMQK